MGNWYTIPPCDLTYYIKQVQEEYDLMNLLFLGAHYLVYQFFGVTSSAIPEALFIAKWVKGGYDANQQLYVQPLARRMYSNQEFWNVLNFGFMFDFGFIYCGINQYYFLLYDWAYFLLIDPNWTIWFTPESAEYNKQKQIETEKREQETADIFANLQF